MKFLRLFRGQTSCELFTLAAPLALQSLAYALLGMIDRVMVGCLSENAIAAVGIGGQMMFFTTTLASAFAQAGGILAAQMRGARDTAGLASLTGTSLIITTIIGVGFSLLLIAVGLPVSLWLSNGNHEIAVVAANFLSLVTLTAPLVLLSFVITGIMRALGDTRTPLVSSLVALCVNTGLNFLLINGNLGFPRWGVTGAAIATNTAQIAGFLVALIAFRRNYFSGYRFAFGHLRLLSSNLAGRITRLSIPIGLDGLFWQAASLAYTRVVGLAPGNALPAYFIFLGVRGLGYIPLGSLGNAAAIIVGKQLGAGHPRRASLATRRAVSLSILSSLAMGFLYLLIADLYLRFFSVDAQTAASAALLIRLFAIVLPFEAAIVTLSGVLRAGGDAFMVSLITFSTFWLIGIPGAWLLGVHLHIGLVGCFCGMAGESVAKSILFSRREAGGRWARRLVLP
ncbi:MAG: MATE family efflux transporter [Candidatus Ozemobacteraceae bacterium]